MYQRKALRELQQSSDIIIKYADKGSAVLVLSKIDCIKEAEGQLNHHAHYKKFNADPSDLSWKLGSTGDLCSPGDKEIKKTKNFLIPHHPQTAKFSWETDCVLNWCPYKNYLILSGLVFATLPIHSSIIH